MGVIFLIYQFCINNILVFFVIVLDIVMLIFFELFKDWYEVQKLGFVNLCDNVMLQVEFVICELRRVKYVVDFIEECFGEDIEVFLREQREGLRFGMKGLERVVEKFEL